MTNPGVNTHPHAANRVVLSLSELDSEQYEAATAPRGPLCILAGAGTGKTRTITHRIAHLIDNNFVDPTQVLAVTFTSRAAGEMRERLRLMGAGTVQARTFHAAALRQLQYFWPTVAGDLPWKLLDNKFPLVAKAVKKAGINGTTETIRDILGEIDWAKATLISADGYAEHISASHREPPLDPEKIALVYRIYEDMKSTNAGMLLDFDDLLLHTAGALESNEQVASEFRSRYRSFVVDEYQDVTPLQQRVLQAWLGERDDLTVVGDANQTIYSFTGADPHFLLNFTREYDNAHLVRLFRDYRSTPQVVELANTVIGQAHGRIAGTRLTLEGQREPGPEPVCEKYEDEALEAMMTARRIGRLIESGVPASQIAIFFRINAQSVNFEKALEDAGIPYHIRGGQGFFRRPEVVQAANRLAKEAASHSQRDIHHTGKELARDVRLILAECGLTPKEPTGAQARERWQSLDALSRLTFDIAQASPDVDLQGLVELLRQRAESNLPPTLEGVTLASIHAAKGLEWDAVFVVGVVDGTIPIKQAIDAGDDAIEEERRLLYVAVTRAREHLSLSWSESRQSGGRKNRVRSRFLDGIFPEPTGQGSRSTQAKHRGVCQECGKVLDTAASKILGHCSECSVPTDANLVEKLRQWRLNRAKERGAPAFTVFSDSTLLAIAENSPHSAQDLLAISGIGPAKLELYGEEILAIVAECS